MSDWTPREIVRATLAYQAPPRVARDFDDSDLRWAGNTVRTAATDWQQIDETRWQRTDEWGNTWGRIDPTSKGEVTRGALADWDKLDTLELPDYSDPADFASARAARAENPDHWLIGGMPGFVFNIARKMRRLDVYLMDLIAEPEKVRALHDKIEAILHDLIRNYGLAGVDSVMFPEDWGTQDRTLISPAMWREEFFPRFERLCQTAADSGCRVFMHSCGAIGAIIPGLIEAGVSLLQFDQPTLHGIDTLAGYQREGKITFWCPVDVQKTLPTGDETRIRAEARQLVETLWARRGGFVAGTYGDMPSIGVQPAWQRWAFDEFLKASRDVATG